MSHASYEPDELRPVCDKLHIIFERRRMSNSEMARRSQLHTGRINSLLNGNRMSVKIVAKMCVGLGVAVERMLDARPLSDEELETIPKGLPTSVSLAEKAQAQSNLDRIMNRFSLKPHDVSRMSGVSSGSVQSLRGNYNDSVSPKTLNMLAEGFGMTFDQMIGATPYSIDALPINASRPAGAYGSSKMPGEAQIHNVYDVLRERLNEVLALMELQASDLQRLSGVPTRMINSVLGGGDCTREIVEQLARGLEVDSDRLLSDRPFAASELARTLGQEKSAKVLHGGGDSETPMSWNPFDHPLPHDGSAMAIVNSGDVEKWLLGESVPLLWKIEECAGDRDTIAVPVNALGEMAEAKWCAPDQREKASTRPYIVVNRARDALMAAEKRALAGAQPLVLARIENVIRLRHLSHDGRTWVYLNGRNRSFERGETLGAVTSVIRKWQ